MVLLTEVLTQCQDLLVGEQHGDEVLLAGEDEPGQNVSLTVSLSVSNLPVVKGVRIFQQILQLADFSCSIWALTLGLLRVLAFILIVNTEPFLPATKRFGSSHLLQDNRLQHLGNIEMKIIESLKH